VKKINLWVEPPLGGSEKQANAKQNGKRGRHGTLSFMRQEQRALSLIKNTL
jgi:hypothetical protein